MVRGQHSEVPLYGVDDNIIGYRFIDPRDIENTADKNKSSLEARYGVDGRLSHYRTTDSVPNPSGQRSDDQRSEVPICDVDGSIVGYQVVDPRDILEPKTDQSTGTSTTKKAEAVSSDCPKEVMGLARDLFRNEPTHINNGAFDLKASRNISQFIEIMEPHQKKKRFGELIWALMDGGSKILIFAERNMSCEEITGDLEALCEGGGFEEVTVKKSEGGWPALCIHGGKKQEERDRVLKEFREGQSTILVTTHAAARGLDVEDIKNVINYDMPGQIEDYVHRIGLTGRAGAKGYTYTFFTQDNARMARELCDILREAKQGIPQTLDEMSRRNYGDGDSNRNTPVLRLSKEDEVHAERKNTISDVNQDSQRTSTKKFITAFLPERCVTIGERDPRFRQ